MYPQRPPLVRVTELISYLYIRGGCESVSIIKGGDPCREWKFYAEYLTLNESELHDWAMNGTGRKQDERWYRDVACDTRI